MLEIAVYYSVWSVFGEDERGTRWRNFEIGVWEGKWQVLPIIPIFWEKLRIFLENDDILGGGGCCTKFGDGFVYPWTKQLSWATKKTD